MSQERKSLPSDLFQRVQIWANYTEANQQRFKDPVERAFVKEMNHLVNIEGELVQLTDLEVQHLHRLYHLLGGVPICPER